MKKLNSVIATVVMMVLSGFLCSAQTVTFDWAKKLSGTNNEGANGVTTDASGNVYVTGSFEGTVDFDPGTAILNFTSAGSADIFIAKLDASGNLTWVIQIGDANADVGVALDLDVSGNIIATGYFTDSPDFDPGIASYHMQAKHRTSCCVINQPNQQLSGSLADVFILKLNSDGEFIWARQVGGSGPDIGVAIETDGAGNIYATGEFSDFRYFSKDTVDFDPGAGVFNLTDGGGFILKLDAAGLFVWAKQFGRAYSGTNGCGTYCTMFDKNYTISIRSLALDNSGNVVTTGFFNSLSTDFDPGAAVSSKVPLGTADMFISKLDNNGDYLWAQQVGGSGATTAGEDLITDGSDNIYITGRFTGAVDFDPGTGSAAITSFSFTGRSPKSDGFVCQLNAAGSYGWAKQLGGSSEDIGRSIALDGNRNVYSTGSFTGKSDFNPATGKNYYYLTSKGLKDIYVSKLNSTGNFVWCKQLGGASDDISTTLAISESESSSIYTAGYFSGTCDFDHGSAVYNLTAMGGNDAFIHKMTESTGNEPISSFEENRIQSGFYIFPNPATNYIFAVNNLGSTLEMSILNLAGQQLTSLIVLPGQTAEINLQTFPSGLLFVESEVDGNRIRQKLIKY
jgi:Beta-propeller repeat/Secretion system C-terminal sorting domain